MDGGRQAHLRLWQILNILDTKEVPVDVIGRIPENFSNAQHDTKDLLRLQFDGERKV